MGLRDQIITDIGGQAYIVKASDDALYFAPCQYAEGYASWLHDDVVMVQMFKPSVADLLPLSQHEAEVRKLLTVYVRIPLVKIRE